MGLRVMATDSYYIRLYTTTDGTQGHTSVTGSKFREERIYAQVDYDFTASRKKPIPPVEDGYSIVTEFDLLAAPQLRGKKITRVTGPFLFLRDKYNSVWLEGGALDSWMTSQHGPFMTLLESYPSNPGRYNNLSVAKEGAYFNGRGGMDATSPVNLDPQGRQGCQTTIGAVVYPWVQSGRYEGRVLIECDSHLGGNAPYIEVEYTGAPVEVVGCAPQTGFVDEKESARFSWSLAPVGENTVGGVVQRRAIFEWRAAGSGTVHSVSIDGPRQACDLPAGTLPNGAIEWRVSATSDAGVQSAFSPWFSLTTLDRSDEAPNLLTPDGAFCDGSKPVRLSWRHNSALSTPQYGFEIQIDEESGLGWKALSGVVASRDSFYLCRANLLPSGNISWRVRTYNSDELASQWSRPARFTARAAPPTPVLRGVERGTPRPFVEWQTGGQLAFQVQVLGSDGAVVFDSLPVFGSVGGYRITRPLEDGRYTFRIRAQNTYGLWSEWGGGEGVVEAPRHMTLTLAGEETQGGVYLLFDGELIL